VPVSFKAQNLLWMEGAPLSEQQSKNLPGQLSAFESQGERMESQKRLLKPMLRLDGENNARPHHSERQRCQTFVGVL
jgi:hypothetical protein